MENKLIKDAHGIFCEVFRRAMTFDAYCHKHLGNPYLREGFSTFVIYEGEDPLGTNSFMAAKLIDPENEIDVTYSCDSAVRAEHRGKRVFSRMIETAIETFAADGTYKIIYATPNGNSHHGFGKLGFHEIGELKRLVCILHPIALLIRKGMRKALKKELKTKAFLSARAEEQELEYEVSLKCPFTEHDFKKINGSYGKIRLKKTREFYQWKADDLPEGEAAYLKVSKNGALAAYIVMKRSEAGIAEIVDYDFFEASAAEKSSIVKWVKKYLAKNSDQIIVVGTGEEEETLRHHAFFERGNMIPFMLWFVDGTMDKERYLDFSNWQVRAIDLDMILNR